MATVTHHHLELLDEKDLFDNKAMTDQEAIERWMRRKCRHLLDDKKWELSSRRERLSPDDTDSYKCSLLKKFRRRHKSSGVRLHPSWPFFESWSRESVVEDTLEVFSLTITRSGSLIISGRIPF
jgi:hypothetical protein